MSEQETPKTDEPQTEVQDDKETTNTEVEESKASEEEKESLLVSDGEKETQETETEEAEPEVLTYELKLPGEALISQDSVDGVVEFAKENKLSSEVAQAIVEREDSAVKAWAESQQEAFQKSREQWLKDAKNDRDFGRDNFDKTCSGVKELLNEFADDELKEGLKNTGFDAYAPLWRFLARLNAAREGDKIAIAEAAASAREVPLAHKMYPDLAPKE